MEQLYCSVLSVSIVGDEELETREKIADIPITNETSPYMGKCVLSLSVIEEYIMLYF